MIDRYIKAVLTVIAVALTLLAVNPWLTRRPGRDTLGARRAEAQTSPAPPAPAPQIVPVPPSATLRWWDDCVVVSKETVPASWGKLAAVAPGGLVFESEGAIRLARLAAYEPVSTDPTKKPCKILEIKRVK